jgi:NAD+ synthase
MNDVLKIDSSIEKDRITGFINSVLKEQGFQKVIIGMSGGIDSTTSFYLLREVIAPENIFIAHLYNQNSQFQDIDAFIKKAGIPKNNIYELSIDPIVESFQQVYPSSDPSADGESRSSNEAMKQFNNDGSRQARTLNSKTTHLDKIRIGNISARIRMIILYDLAKKHNALVCGTENKTEYLLGYFTRFGDQASDFEPIQHLYKTQVFQLANFLNIPKNIIDQTPTAGLWPGQTDELEYGFTYKEADQVLFYYYDKKLKIEEIKGMGLKNAGKIINFSLRNAYKHSAPYTLSTTNTNTKYHER